MTTGEKIKFRREQLGLTVDQLAERIGKNRATIYRYENNGIKKLPLDILEPLANALCVTPGDLLGTPDKKEIPSGYTSMPPMKEVPIIGNVACGTPITAQQESSGTTYIPGDWHADFVIIAVGDSMAPDIRDGDLVAIRSQHQVDNGQIAAVHIGEEATLKRLYFYPDKNRLELRPINPAYEMQVYFGDELYDVIVDGLAIGLCRSFE